MFYYNAKDVCDRFEIPYIAVSKKSAGSKKPSTGRNVFGFIDEAKMVDAVRNAPEGEWHNLCRDLCAHWVARGLSDEQIVLFAPVLTQEGWTTKKTLEDMETLVVTARERGFGPKHLKNDEIIPDMSIVEANSRPAPPFPIKALPNKLSNFANELAISKGCPIDYVICGILVFGAGLVGNARSFSPWTGWTEPCALYGANVGIPASAKTPALKPMIKAIRKIEKNLMLDYEETLRVWETDKEIAQLARDGWHDNCKTAKRENQPIPTMPEDAVEPRKPPAPALVLSDATPEKLLRLAEHSPRGFSVFRDELSGLLQTFSKAGRENERSIYLQGCQGDEYRIDRVKDDEPIIIDRFLISVVGSIQPDKFETLLLNGDDDGLAARILYFAPNWQRPARPQAPVDLNLLDTAFCRLHALQMEDVFGDLEPITMRFEPDASDYFEDALSGIYDQLETSTGLFRSFLGKMPGMLVRLSGLLELLEHASNSEMSKPSKISKNAVMNALTLITDYFVPMAERVFGNLSYSKAGRNASLIAKKIYNEHLSIVNAKKVRDESWISGLREARDVDDALTFLVDKGWLIDASNRASSKAGRQRKDFKVNPLIWRSDSSNSSDSKGAE